MGEGTVTVIHRRSDWTTVPAPDSNSVVVSLLRGVAVHWNGPAVPKSALTAPARFLEGVRRFHTETRGWSDFAYNVAVDQQGDIWQGRGWRFQSAANGTETLNDQYLAIFAIIGGNQVPSPLMVAGIREAVRHFRNHYPDAHKIVGHRDLHSTTCPGDRLYHHLQAGHFQPPKPVPAPVIVCTHCCPKHCAVTK